MNSLTAFFRREAALFASIVTTILFFTVLAGPMKNLDSPVAFAFYSAWLLAIILWAAFSVLRHADVIAHRLGEPLGTLILTIAVMGIEVSIIMAVMFTGEPNPAFARDTMFAVIMLVVNGLVGLALLMGGLKHHEQTYNLQSAQSYLGVLLPLSVCVLILPNFTQSTPEGTYSTPQLIFVGVISILIYAVFLAIQTVRHREFFADPNSANFEHEHDADEPSLVPHFILLILYLIPIVLLAKNLGYAMDYAIVTLGAPPAIGGVIVAAMVLAPEGLSALFAALNNRLQRSVNLLLGSSVASIGLTAPAVVAITLVTGNALTLGLSHADSVLLALTLATAIITFFSGKTNILQGAIHLVLFLAYLILIFD
ncbi:MAG: ionic transporter y4hA [Chthoniobacterales bacterium]